MQRAVGNVESTNAERFARLEAVVRDSASNKAMLDQVQVRLDHSMSEVQAARDLSRQQEIDLLKDQLAHKRQLEREHSKTLTALMEEVQTGHETNEQVLFL